MPEDFVNRMLTNPSLARQVRLVLPADQDVPPEEQEVVVRHLEAATNLLASPIPLNRLMSELGLTDSELNRRSIRRILHALAVPVHDSWQLRPERMTYEGE